MSAIAIKSRDTAITSPALWLDLVSLALVAAGNAVLAARIETGPLALSLVVVPLAVRLVQLRSEIVKVPLSIPFILFLASAWIGVTVSYDPELSRRKFELLLGSVALYYVLATTRTDFAKRAVVWGVLALGTGIAIFFVTQHNFAQEPIKVEALNEIGLLLNRLTPQFGLHTPHANLIAGIMLLALPYAAVLGYHSLRQNQVLTLIACGAMGVVIAFGLVMTTSRGALLALALLLGAGAFLYVAARLAKRAGYTPGIGVAAAINLALIIFLLGFVFAKSQIISVLNTAFGNISGVPRLELYNQVIQLASDYGFTGAGLDTFSLHYSTYELLINVPFLSHGHNLILQVWFEQGILGLIAFVWLIVGFYIWFAQRSGRMNWLALASAAAFTMVLMHGMVDVVFYFSRVISLMFIPLGLTVCALEPFVPFEQGGKRRTRRVWTLGAIAAGVLLIIGVGLIVARRQQLISAWAANQGALNQARMELPLVEYPAPTPGQVRREVDLSQANKLFVNALQADPSNRTAHARLGIIALDRSEFPLALGHLEAAYSTDNFNRAVIKALGYTYVWTGQPDKAVPLLKQIPEAEAELSYAAFEWRGRDRDDLAAYASNMVQRLKR